MENLNNKFRETDNNNETKDLHRSMFELTKDLREHERLLRDTDFFGIKTDKKLIDKIKKR